MTFERLRRSIVFAKLVKLRQLGLASLHAMSDVPVYDETPLRLRPPQSRYQGAGGGGVGAEQRTDLVPHVGAVAPTSNTTIVKLFQTQNVHGAYVTLRRSPDPGSQEVPLFIMGRAMAPPKVLHRTKAANEAQALEEVDTTSAGENAFGMRWRHASVDRYAANELLSLIHI